MVSTVVEAVAMTTMMIVTMRMVNNCDADDVDNDVNDSGDAVEDEEDDDDRGRRCRCCCRR